MGFVAARRERKRQEYAAQAIERRIARRKKEIERLAMFEWDRMTKLLIDVWGGQFHHKHVARFLRPMDEGMKIAHSELMKGYRVNMRDGVRWGPHEEFDSRKAN